MNFLWNFLKAKLLGRSPTNDIKTQTMSYLLSSCKYNTAVIVSRTIMSIWRVVPGMTFFGGDKIFFSQLSYLFLMITHSSYQPTNSDEKFSRQKILKKNLGHAKELQQVEIDENVIVTSLYIDEFFIFVGHSNGIISRHFSNKIFSTFSSLFFSHFFF